jgi:hypothetical protein
MKNAFVVGCIVTLGLLDQSPAAQADVKVVHTYGSSLGQEVANVIAVSASKLLPLLPAGYNIVPAASLGFGEADQGIVAIANYRGIDPTVDNKKSATKNQIAIDLGIVVAEPAQAVEAGVSIPGAFHLYTLAIYTNDARYAASLRRADMPVEFENKISYQREMNDATGVGDLIVTVPSKDTPFRTLNSGQGYAPAVGAFNAVFWHDGRKGKAVLHFRDQPFRLGTAASHIYTQPDSAWETLLHGGGLGPCASDPRTGFSCVTAPSLNLRYDEGSVGTLSLID